MDNLRKHIVKSYDQDLEHLLQQITEMGGLVEDQLNHAIECLVNRNPTLAAQIIASDSKIDHLEKEIYQNTVQLLALRQPMAQDLRRIITSIRISSDLERMGDLAENIAKRALILMEYSEFNVDGLKRLGSLVIRMVTEMINAYVSEDLHKAQTLWKQDSLVNDLYNSLFLSYMDEMKSHPDHIHVYTHLLFIAKNLERAADHSKNIAESIHYILMGETNFCELPPVSHSASS